MATVAKEIFIEAPPERVAGYLEDPMHFLEIWPSMVDISGIETLPNGGHRYHWTYKMAGMRFEGDSETVEFQQNRHFVAKNTGQIPSTFDWTFTPSNGGTTVAVKADYEIPKKLLTKLAEPFLLRLNDREADALLTNLKDRIEVP